MLHHLGQVGPEKPEGVLDKVFFCLLGSVTLL